MPSKESKTQSLIIMAFEDYKAARVLINLDYNMQGATLASSSIEKYIKALATFLGKPYKRKHLDTLENVIGIFDNTVYQVIFRSIDKYFLSILGKAYKFRYYDNLEQADSFGFVVNQFLAELDFLVYSIESILSGWKSPYKREIEQRNPDLLKNNYILNGLTKKEFAESPSSFFAIYVNPANLQPLLANLADVKRTFPYEGHMLNVQIKIG